MQTPVPLLDALLCINDATPRDAVHQMAADEALLLTAPGPVLRFYRWAQPAVTIGCFVPLKEVGWMRRGRDMARRWTGGGIVEHGADTTYAFILPGGITPGAARAWYGHLHGLLAGFMEGEAQLHRGDERSAGGVCFQQPVRDDLLRDGVKIAGAAQRRTRWGLLHQGSIAGAMSVQQRAAFARLVAGRVEERAELPAVAVDRVEEVARTRYAREEWLRRW